MANPSTAACYGVPIGAEISFTSNIISAREWFNRKYGHSRERRRIRTPAINLEYLRFLLYWPRPLVSVAAQESVIAEW